MTSLNSKQLAFILDIKKEDARAKMCHAWCKFHDIPNKAFVNEKNKISDDYPELMPIGILAQGLSLPDLQKAVDDIEQNYLNRPSTKKWILCDFPENELRLGKDTLNIPPVLKSILPTHTVDIIKQEWATRFPKVKIK